jgi:hypothetical protein
MHGSILYKSDLAMSVDTVVMYMEDKVKARALQSVDQKV